MAGMQSQDLVKWCGMLNLPAIGTRLDMSIKIQSHLGYIDSTAINSSLAVAKAKASAIKKIANAEVKNAKLHAQLLEGQQKVEDAKAVLATSSESGGGGSKFIRSGIGKNNIGRIILKYFQNAEMCKRFFPNSIPLYISIFYLYLFISGESNPLIAKLAAKLAEKQGAAGAASSSIFGAQVPVPDAVASDTMSMPGGACAAGESPPWADVKCIPSPNDIAQRFNIGTDSADTDTTFTKDNNEWFKKEEAKTAAHLAALQKRDEEELEAHLAAVKKQFLEDRRKKVITDESSDEEGTKQKFVITQFPIGSTPEPPPSLISFTDAVGTDASSPGLSSVLSNFTPPAALHGETPEDKMQIFIKDFKGKTFLISVLPTDNIEGIKGMIEAKKEVPRERFSLQGKGKPLLRNKTVAEVGITGGDKLEMTQPIRGGGNFPLIGKL